MDENKTREEDRAAAKKATPYDDVFALIEARYGEDAGPSTEPALTEGFDCGCDCDDTEAPASNTAGEASGEADASSCCG